MDKMSKFIQNFTDLIEVLTLNGNETIEEFLKDDSKNKNKIQKFEKMSMNLCYRYKLHLNDKDGRMRMSDRQARVLEGLLKKYNINVDNYLESFGHLTQLKDLLSSDEETSKANEDLLCNESEEEIEVVEIDDNDSKVDDNVCGLKKESDEFETLKNKNNNLQSLITNYYETVDQIKKEITKLLIENSNISFDTIIEKFEDKVDLRTLKSILNDIRRELPGLKETIFLDSKVGLYSMSDAKNEMRYYQYSDITQKFDLPDDGIFKFIFRSDSHLDLLSGEDSLKRIMEPYSKLSSVNGNAPIIDLGDLIDTSNYALNSWNSGDKDRIKLIYNFYQRYASVINKEFGDLGHFILLGNHDRVPFYLGIDPIQVMLNNCDNIKSLGMMNASLEIKNLNIGLLHGICDKNGHFLSPKSYEFNERLVELSDIYNVIFTGHYHRGMLFDNPKTVLLNSNIRRPLVLSVEVKNGKVNTIWGKEVFMNNENKLCDGNEFELYKKPKTIKGVIKF